MENFLAKNLPELTKTSRSSMVNILGFGDLFSKTIYLKLSLIIVSFKKEFTKMV